MPKINKVVSTVWYDKENYHTLRNVFPESEFVYADFYDKEGSFLLKSACRKKYP